MNQTNQLDFQEKRNRICSYLEKKGYDALLLSRRDNFAWASFGGNNTVLKNVMEGFGVLAFTKDKVYLVARYMDADRIMDEELKGLDIEEVCIKWFEEEPIQKAMNITGGRIASDVPYAGCDYVLDDVYALHLPYTSREVERWEQIGREFDEIMLRTAQKAERGMSEIEIQAILDYETEMAGGTPYITLIGGDDRLKKYRHPLPTDYRIQKNALIHVVGFKYGMSVALTRMFTFGEADEELLSTYDYLNQIQVNAFSRLIPGKRMGVILEERQEYLKTIGRSWEYENHFPGGDTGYPLGNSKPFLENREIIDTQCFDIYLTLTGAKAEELAMASENGAKYLSKGYWPTKEYRCGSYTCELPVILQKK